MLMENEKLFLKDRKRIQMLQIQTHRKLISIYTARKIKQLKMIHRSSKIRETTSLQRATLRVIDLIVVQRHMDLTIVVANHISQMIQHWFMLYRILNRDVNNFVRSSYDKESINLPKDSMVLFLMGQIEFLRDEIKIKNNIIERLLTLKSVMHDNQLFPYNSQQIKKI